MKTSLGLKDGCEHSRDWHSRSAQTNKLQKKRDRAPPFLSTVLSSSLGFFTVQETPVASERRRGHSITTGGNRMLTDSGTAPKNPQ